jgi:uncharacterized protein YndB with AHSA1/START domain
MKAFTGETSSHIDASGAGVFALITDVERLPEWNAAIEAVVSQPDELAPGAEWTVRMHPARGMRWGSISQLVELDRERLRFSYVTRNADGNPSRVEWAWQVEPDGSGCVVTVSWSCWLETMDRRLLAGPIRKRQLAREVPTSLAALAASLRPATHG